MFQHRQLPLELEEEPQQTKQGIRLITWISLT